MALASRIINLQLHRNVLLKNKMEMFQHVRLLTMKSMPAQPEVQMDHDDKNMKLNRPMSPHLSIYAYELQSFLSITHRATGLGLAAGTTMFAVGALVLPHDLTHYVDAVAAMNLNPALIFGAKFIISLPIVFHTLNGIRHLVWDMGKLLYIKEVMKSGYALLALSLVGSFGLALL